MNRTEEALKAFVGLRRTNDIVESQDRIDVSKSDLSMNEFAVLELLLHKGDTPIQQIKEKILVASSSTTYIIDKLEKKGLVERRQDTVDRRVTYATLTEKGRELIETIFPTHAKVIEAMFDCLSDEELTQFRNYLKTISAHVQRM